MEADLDSVFTRAAESVKSKAGTLSETTLLELYGLYKQSVDGPCQTAKPGFWDFKGCRKWNAWKNLDNLSTEDAMLKYIDLVREIVPDFEVTKPKSWITVSCMQNRESNIPEDEKTVFDYCKEGNLAMLQSAGIHNLNERDSEGLCLIHWAADRGASDILEYLAVRGADLNAQDSDGQTALHYASSCDNAECVVVLLRHGADPGMCDKDGLSPLDVASNDVKQLLEKAKVSSERISCGT